MEFIMENAIKKQEEKSKKDVVIGHANIKVIGIGGAGNNMCDWLYEKGIQGAKIVSIILMLNT